MIILFIKHCYRTLKVPGSLVKKIIITGAPLMLNEFLWAGGLTLQTQALSTKGLATVGGLNICNTIGNISNCIFVTMGTTIAIVVGQLLGAGKTERYQSDCYTNGCFFTFNIIWHDYNSWYTWTCISTFL